LVPQKTTVKLGSIGQILVDSYQIGIGDVLEITTWKEPDFSRQNVMVRTDGKITFPLLSDVPAAGLSPMELKYNLEVGLKAYIEHPVVTVHLINPESQKFYILGEVARTGEYPLVKHLTVLQAFALAGGFTEWASKKEIILLRHEGGKDKIYRINYLPKRKSSSCVTKAARTKSTASTTKTSPKAKTSARTSNSEQTTPLSFREYN
jgi:polysaccharide export outer membrane protein